LDEADFSEAERIIVSLLPDEEIRKTCLTVFLESIDQANTCGSEKWGVHYSYYSRDRVRLLVGNLVVFALQKGRIWLALDQRLLEKSKGKQRLLELSKSWQWDTDDYPEYVQIPSKNGYYTPSEDHLKIWPIIREFHLELVRNAAKKYRRLNKRSQSKYTPDVLEYLRVELGQRIPEPVYEDFADRFFFRLPEEIPDDISFFEGSKQRVTINAYERSPKARQECIAYYGTSCVVCGFNFAEAYGEVGEGLIHVHHLKPLAGIGEGYEVNPVSDLRPVCPNCHAIIHKRSPPYTIEEIQNLLKTRELQ
jgi:5-methylcytosine-specific restriction protein A